MSESDIVRAAGVIREGGIVAFPTETYYGLAVDPFNESALKKLFRIKNRPEVKPVLVLVSGQDELSRVTTAIPAIAQRLMDRFWPGPLTLVLPARKELSSYITGGTNTVGVRLSSHPVAMSLLKACGIPVTATSANKSNQSPAVTANEAKRIFGNQVDLVLDGGRTPGESSSTLVGFENSGIKCIREGRIPFQEIMSYIQEVE